jgi:hypothetical protein
MTLKEAFVVYFEALYKLLSGGTEGNHEINEDRRCPDRDSNLVPPIYKSLCPHTEPFAFATMRVFTLIKFEHFGFCL